MFEAFWPLKLAPAHHDGPGSHDLLRSEFLKELGVPAQLHRFDVLHGRFGAMLGQELKLTA